MKRFTYLVSLPFLYLLSLLPWRVMYGCSDVLYLLNHYVLGYRRKVILDNLRNSFTEKTEDEIQALAKKFEAYACDLALETIKTLTISRRALNKHVTLSDVSVLQHYFDQKQSVILVMGHFGNWELAGARFSAADLHALHVIYHPLSNPYFDRLFYTMRTRLGTSLYTMKGAFRGIVRDRNKVTAELLVDDPATTQEGVVSELHTRRLEQDIREQPEIWLWSHRRWKHQRPRES